MSTQTSLVTLAAVVIMTLVAAVVFLRAGHATPTALSQWQTRVLATSDIAVPHKLDTNDEVAALERIQYALSEVGDGGTYAWKRWHGRLAGIVHPTVSFK